MLYLRSGSFFHKNSENVVWFFITIKQPPTSVEVFLDASNVSICSIIFLTLTLIRNYCSQQGFLKWNIYVIYMLSDMYVCMSKYVLWNFYIKIVCSNHTKKNEY